MVALSGRCDEEVLSLLLNLPENSKTSLAVEELCSLPALDLYTMFVLFIQNLNLRHIMYKVRCKRPKHLVPCFTFCRWSNNAIISSYVLALWKIILSSFRFTKQTQKLKNGVVSC